jgi:hypothetical protein
MQLVSEGKESARQLYNLERAERLAEDGVSSDEGED